MGGDETLDSALEIDSSTGMFSLQAGKTYELVLFHHQPSDVTSPEKFTISVDGEILRVIGRNTFEISSRYDLVTLPIHAVESEKYESRDTVLVVEPERPVQGATLNIPIRVKSGLGRTVVAAAGSAIGLILIAIPTLLTKASSVAKLSFIIFGTVLVTSLGVLGLRIGGR